MANRASGRVVGTSTCRAGWRGRWGALLGPGDRGWVGLGLAMGPLRVGEAVPGRGRGEGNSGEVAQRSWEGAVVISGSRVGTITGTVTGGRFWRGSRLVSS